jgi:hypothetical protein
MQRQGSNSSSSSSSSFLKMTQCTKVRWQQQAVSIPRVECNQQ